MEELDRKKKFTANYVDPKGTNGINGGNRFERADAMFADDVNKMIENQMYLKATKADLESPDFSGTPTIDGTEISRAGHTHTPAEIGAASAVHSHNAGEIENFAHTHNVSEITGALAAKSPITPAKRCKISYNQNGLVTGGEDLTVADIPAGLVEGSGDVSVTRNSSGKYVVGYYNTSSRLIGYRYTQKSLSYSAQTLTFNSSNLTSGKAKGAIQLLFLRLNQSETGNAVDIPIDMLLYMYQTKQTYYLLGDSGGQIGMKVTGCDLVFVGPYTNILVTADFTYSSRSYGSYYGSGLRAEWWGRPLEAVSGTSGY